MYQLLFGINLQKGRTPCYIFEKHFKVPQHAFLHWVTDIKIQKA